MTGSATCRALLAHRGDGPQYNLRKLNPPGFSKFWRQPKNEEDRVSFAVRRVRGRDRLCVSRTIVRVVRDGSPRDAQEDAGWSRCCDLFQRSDRVLDGI